MFPSLPAIDRHIGPSMATVRRTPQGIEFASRGTIPLPADAATVIAMCVMSQYGSLVNFSNSPFQSSVEPPAVVQPANQEPAAQDPNGQQPGGQEACPQQDSPGKQNDGSGK